ncbi:HAUS augmin-like complex subunit 3 [Tachypleus tridentatus]|uniref:HAUS augmin-like complex subunit 3 n=1 Tax=Tachypleus tridentatus TaxID=6853 RepID=UPI003FD4DF32
MENSQHSVQHQVLELLKSAVPNAVQQYVQMNSAVVITGDYQLKLARQEYFLDKQNIVIEHLLKQLSKARVPADGHGSGSPNSQRSL